MSVNHHHDVSKLLAGVRKGQSDAERDLHALVYQELRQLAQVVFSDQDVNHTLQPTALVHEAWLKLVGNLESVENRRHFFRLAARAMRQVLADHARAARREKRGGVRRSVTFHSDIAVAAHTMIDVVVLNDLLEQLATLHSRHAQVVEMRLLGGLTIAETASELGVSQSTVESDWATARAWLRSELAED